MTICDLVKLNSSIVGPATFLQYLQNPAITRDSFTAIDVNILDGIDITIEDGIITSDLIEAPITCVNSTDPITIELVDTPVLGTIIVDNTCNVN